MSETRKYVRLGLVGSGGHARVYKARQKGTNRLVALKVMAARDSKAFLRESELHARLHHSNIVQIYDVGPWRKEAEDTFDDPPGNLWYIAMQYVEGSDLHSMRAHKEMRDPRVAVRLVAKVARTIEFAHSHYVVHCDLKPQNILIDRAGTPFVSDFGISQALDGKAHAARNATPAYMAPEQCREEPEERWTDVYALGSILYQLATGITPYPEEWSVEERLDEFAANKMPLPASLVARKSKWSSGSKLDRDFDTICAGALAILPTARYKSANALADDLDRWVLGLPICGPERVRPPLLQTILRFPRRNMGAMSIALLAGILMLGGVLLIAVARSELEAWILRNNVSLVRLNAQILRRGMRDFRDVVPKLASDKVVLDALAQPKRCEPSAEGQVLETPEWRKLMNDGIWMDGPDQAYVSDRYGCFYKYWPAPGPASVYTHWYGFRHYFECGAELGMKHSRDTCVARTFRSEYDWYQNTLRMAFATPVYDEEDRWIGVFVAAWKVEQPLADIQLGPIDDESSVSMIVARDLERSQAESLFESADQVPTCECNLASASTARGEPANLQMLKAGRKNELLILPRTGSRAEKLLDDKQAKAIVDAVKSGTGLAHFIDPRDGRPKLAAFETLQRVDAPGQKPIEAADLAPLLMVATDRAVLDRYTAWLTWTGVVLWAASILLFVGFFATLARRDDEQLRWLKGNSP